MNELERIAQSNLAEHEKERERTRLAKERWREISDAPQMQQTDFWCKDCKQDVSAPGYKLVKGSQAHALEASAVYLGQCPQGHGLVRFITDKWNDPYFHYSDHVKRMRDKHADDLLTPNDPRFKYVYPNEWRKLQADKESRERLGL